MSTVASRYHTATIVLHWFMLLLIAAVFATMECRGVFPRGSEPRELMKTLHFMLGLSVFFLVLVRIAVRLRTTAPAIEPAQPPIVLLAAKLMHLGLYVFMIAMPLVGWLILSAAGKPIPFFGLELPAMVAPDKHTMHLAEDIHETLATCAYGLIALHAVAALFHHYIKHDNTLARMLPNRKS